jgi:hypothetical protein
MPVGGARVLDLQGLEQGEGLGGELLQGGAGDGELAHGEAADEYVLEGLVDGPEAGAVLDALHGRDEDALEQTQVLRLVRAAGLDGADVPADVEGVEEGEAGAGGGEVGGSR